MVIERKKVGYTSHFSPQNRKATGSYDRIPPGCCPKTNGGAPLSGNVSATTVGQRISAHEDKI
jgi:hypothetical protein